jgi:hypothetical protein
VIVVTKILNMLMLYVTGRIEVHCEHHSINTTYPLLLSDFLWLDHYLLSHLYCVAREK